MKINVPVDPLVLPPALDAYLEHEKNITELDAKLFRFIWTELIRPKDRLFMVTSDAELAFQLGVVDSEAKKSRIRLSEKGLIVSIVKTRAGRCILSSEVPVWKAMLGEYGLSVGAPESLMTFLKDNGHVPQGMAAETYFVDLISIARINHHGSFIVGKKQYPEDVLKAPRG